MALSLLPPDFLFRLRRSLTVSAVLVLTLTAGICDDDDDDDGLGPSVDCIDEFDFTDAPFDEDDVRAIAVGDSESGSLTSSDVLEEGYYFDIWAFAVESNGTVTITVDPTGFDADMALVTSAGSLVEYVDDYFEGEAEEIVRSLNEGCFALVVSSYEPGETGSYTLSID